eukprot:3538393-Alexandrium_andersonii.AAC.1
MWPAGARSPSKPLARGPSRNPSSVISAISGATPQTATTKRSVHGVRACVCRGRRCSFAERCA